MSVLNAIGNTALVQLRNVVPAGCAEIFVKLEFQNPTGSMKDRMAVGAIAKAEETGKLNAGDTVVEYTGGSTGASLALVCSTQGYPIKIVSSDAFSQEKLNQMRAFGAEVTVLPSEGGSATKQLFLDMIEEATRLSREPNTYFFNQIHNPDTIHGYLGLGEEIWRQTNGKVNAFVQAVGTGASSRGVATALKKRNLEIKLIVVEPAESPVLSGGQPGSHKIEGIGIGYTPPLFDSAIVDGVIPISTDEAKEMARRIAREEALFAGTSSGANVLAAIEVAKSLGPGNTVVTLMVDSGLKYLNTDVYRPD